MTTHQDTQKATPRRKRLDLARRVIRGGLAIIGAVAILGGSIGVIFDYQDFDRTSGGYDAPYTDWTGTPIDWNAGAVTSDGFYKPGRVIDVSLNCTSGMVTFHAFGFAQDWRKVSPRAIAIHQPRQACEAADFEPQF